MSDMLDLQVHLQDTIALQSRLQGDLAHGPTTPWLLIELQSLEKRRLRLEAEFRVAANAVGKEVFRYRLIPEGRDATIAGVSSTLGDFQQVFSLFYDAIKTGPKKISRVAADVMAKTSLTLSYMFPGSIGFALAVPDDRDLFGSDIEHTIQEIRDAVKARDSKEVLAFAHKLGIGPIRTLSRWADDHVKHQLSADIEWNFIGEMPQHVLIQHVELKRLHDVIAATSEKETEEFDLVAELKGADVSGKTFHLVTSNGVDLRGRSGDVINEEHKVELPKWYKAKLRKTIKVYYSTDQKDETHELLELTPV